MMYETSSIMVLFRFYMAIKSIYIEPIIEMMCCLTMSRVLEVMEHAEILAQRLLEIITF